jgi:hypothetical protein
MIRRLLDLRLRLAILLFASHAVAIAAYGFVNQPGPGRPPIYDVRSFETDFRTLHECLARVARDQGLKIQQSGGGFGGAAVRKDFNYGAEGYRIVPDREKLPFLKSQHSLMFVIGTEFDDQTPTLKLDPDTGELTILKGMDIGVNVSQIMIHFFLKDEKSKVICEVELVRKYSEKGIKVLLTSPEKDGRAKCREIMTSIESKMKLASRLKEAKKKRMAL